MVKNNTGRKKNVIGDELGIKGGGIYCVCPFDRFDEFGKTVFKVGQSVDLENRIDTYATYFPSGVYICCALANPPVRTNGTRYVSSETKISKYLKIERFIFDFLEENGATQVYSTARIKHQNVKKQGATEWFYSTEELIHTAFERANKEFGGDLHIFFLGNINKEALASERKKPNYIGRIIYHFPK